MTHITNGFSAFALEPFPTIEAGSDIAAAITTVLNEQDLVLEDGDILVVASKIVSIAEDRYVDLSTITPSAQALDIAQRTGKSPEVVQLVLDHSTDHFLGTDRGPIIATHQLGLQLTSAGIDRAGSNGAWLLPADPDASARALRDTLAKAAGAQIAVVIADSDGRADRRGATVISIGAAGIAPLRVSEHAEPGGKTKRQEETLSDLVAAAAGVILGQRGRGAPVAVLRGIAYEADDTGVASILHKAPR
ncbi:coenzyme F420-0:L-glutamate ligase [Streptomyces sp. NBC_01304]|uniref:coenzyme F420-0:L-glutamate ligase n=1 Tax=Streptomyces sp. NBC_01304 TaxID=2903818 RepID=UPI002E126CEB|nr:coenzyme F420-0:L-glutamate ligase [Streptomyces sp. NBC_01304]